MSVTVNINDLSLVHRVSGGTAKNTIPDVCKTPGSGIPLPYNIVSYSSTLSKGTVTVKADGGNSAAHKPSEFSTCIGDAPGSYGGVASGTIMAESTWISYSMDVFFESQNACRLTDKMFMNHMNTVCAGGVKQLKLYVRDPKMNLLCNVFCEMHEMRKKVKKGDKKAIEAAKKKGLLGRHGQFLSDKGADQLASGKYADNFAKLGLRSKPSMMVRMSARLRKVFKANNVRRTVRSASAVRKLMEGRIKRKLAKIAATKAAKKAATAWLKFVPVVNVISTAYDIYDIASTGYDIYKELDALKNLPDGDYVEMKPDFATFDGDGAPDDIYDMKFEGDRYRNGQKELYEEAAKDGKVTKIDEDACNKCKTIGR